MNYIAQLKGFWNWRKLNILSSKQADLYFAILECANAAFWKKKFNIPNATLESMCQMSRGELHKQRNVLIQLGLIRYEKGAKNKAGVYTISILYDTHLDTNVDTHLDTHSDTHLDTNVEHIHKTKTKTKTKTIKHAYGKYAHVRLTDEEFEQLHKDYPNADQLIAFLDEYIEMKGYKAKNHYLAIKNWVVDAVDERSRRRKGSESSRAVPNDGFVNVKTIDYEAAELEALRKRVQRG